MSADEARFALRAALEGDDEVFTEAADRLLSDEQASAVLGEALRADDPVDRLVAGVLLDRAEEAAAAAAESEPDATAPPGVDRPDVERYLRIAQRWYSGTVVVAPPAEPVAAALDQVFGPGLSRAFAVRLVKHPSDPGWRAAVQLAYIRLRPSPETTDALLRYASQTPVPALQEAAAAAVLANRDSDLARKIAAERGRLAAQGRTLPGPIGAIA